MSRNYDVVIVGAGTAGLQAVKEVKKRGGRVLLIDRGPLGTTCSRVGCMPSKVFLQLAHDYARQKKLKELEVLSQLEAPRLPQIMAHVRKMRDHFVGFTLKTIEELGEEFHKGDAHFLGPDRLCVEGLGEVKARAIIVATGTAPFIPDEWKPFESFLVTTDSFFEMTDIPKRWAVIGLGPLSLELSSGLSDLGCEVTIFERKDSLAGMKDEVVKAKAMEVFQETMAIHLHAETKLEQRGSALVIHDRGKVYEVDRVLVAAGRKPNFKELAFEKSGCTIDDKGRPIVDLESLQAKTSSGSRLFLAGDFLGDRPLMHEASDEGRIAGYNAMETEAKKFERRTKLAITFSHPQLARVGDELSAIKDPAIGEVSFETQGRRKIMAEPRGHMRVYADRSSGLLRGAEIMAPEGEHLAHLLALAIGQKMTLDQVLAMPFYHPTLEEGLRTALTDARRKLDLSRSPVPGLKLKES